MGQDEATTLAQETGRPRPGRPSDWEAWRTEIRAFCADTRAELAAIASAVAKDPRHALPERGTAHVEEHGSSDELLLQDTADRLDKLKQQLAERLQGKATRLPDGAAERPDPYFAASPRFNA